MGGLKTRLLVSSPSGLLKDSAIAPPIRPCPSARGALMPKRQGFIIPIGQRPYDQTDIAQHPEDTWACLAPKLTIATCSLAGCFRCHMSFLDVDGAWLT